MIRLRMFLVFIGGFLGPLNLGLFFTITSKYNHIPILEKMTNLKVFEHYSSLSYFLFFVPCLISTGLTVLVLWNKLLAARTKLQHMLWGTIFGGVATILSTGILILFGVIYNYSNGVSSTAETFLGIGIAIPGGMALGAVLIIFFSPALLIAGPLYGLIAMALKQKFLAEL